MKKLIASLFFLVAATAQGNDSIMLRTSKCSLFGNLKIKVTGLESYGRVARGYLKADTTSSTCKSELAHLRRVMGRGNASVNTSVRNTTFTRQIDTGRDDHIDAIYGQVCEVYKRTTLNVVIPRFSSIVFTNFSDKLVRRYNGYCRR